jgi:hypothetical protein
MNAAPFSWDTYIGSLVAVGLGWLLHEISDRLKIRREDRRAVGRALSEFLDVRHGIRAIPLYVEEIRKKYSISPQDAAMLRQVLEIFLPGVEQLQKRYNDAIDGVSGRLPLLAFDLRSKDFLSPTLRQLRLTVLQQNPEQADLWFKFEDEALRIALPRLDRLVLSLARLHGWRTWWQVRSTLKEPFVLPKEFEELISRMQAAAASVSPGSPPPVEFQSS